MRVELPTVSFLVEDLPDYVVDNIVALWGKQDPSLLRFINTMEIDNQVLTIAIELNYVQRAIDSSVGGQTFASHFLTLIKNACGKPRGLLALMQKYDEGSDHNYIFWGGGGTVYSDDEAFNNLLEPDEIVKAYMPQDHDYSYVSFSKGYGRIKKNTVYRLVEVESFDD
jgi:hypothetical protein